MSRRLQTWIEAIGLDVGTLELRDGLEDLERSPTVLWELASATWRGDVGPLWAGSVDDRWEARVTLPPGAPTDTDFDTDENGPRTATTPTLRASGIRAWYAIEIAESTPDDTSIVYRLYDAAGDVELWWSGIEWDEATTADHWNTAAEVQAHFAELAGSVRELAVIAWLSTDDSEVAPSFYGFKVAYGLQMVAAFDDALLRTVVSSLVDEIRVTGVIEFTTTEEIDQIEVPGDEWPYKVTDVQAAFDLTDDPDELEELAGDYDADTGVWTPTAPIAAEHVVRVEFEWRPDVVARRHQDVEELAAVPALYVAASGPPTTMRGQDSLEVRDLESSPPRAVLMPSPDAVTVPLQVRIVCELGDDTDRLAAAVRHWLGDGELRAFFSPVTGSMISVQSLTPGIWGVDQLGQGVSEARASWLLRFSQPRALEHRTITLIRRGGTTFTTGD